MPTSPEKKKIAKKPMDDQLFEKNSINLQPENRQIGSAGWCSNG